MTILPLRPGWKDGESYSGYVLRLAQENNCSLIFLAKMLERTKYGLLCLPPDQLLPELGVAAPRLQLLHPPQAHLKRHAPILAGRAAFTSVCPICLREDREAPYIRSRWDLPLEFTCHVHGCMLVRACSSCKEPISVFRRSLTRCDCGQFFTSLPIQSPPGWILTLKSVMQVSRQGSLTFAAASDGEIAGVVLIKQIARLSAAEDAKAREGCRVRVNHAWVNSEDLIAVAPWFENWPTSFERHYVHKRWTPPSPTEIAPGVLPQLDARRLPAIQSVIDDVVRRRQTTRRPRGTESLDAREWVSLKQLVRHAGIHNELVKYWIKVGFLKGVERIPERGVEAYRIPADQARQAIAFIKSTSSLRTVSRELGLSVPALHALVRAGGVKAYFASPSTYTARLIPEQIFELASILRDRSRGRPRSSGDVITLERALIVAGKRGRQLPKLLVRDLLTSKLTLYTLDPVGVCLTSQSLKLNQFERWLEAQHGE